MKIINGGFTNRNNIIPARIKDARIARGLSLADLSELIGVTSQAISQYELGTSTPSGCVLLKLIEVLSFPLNYFKKTKENMNQDYTNSAVYFRSMKTTPKKLKEAYKYRIEWADEIYNYLNKYVNFPNTDLPDISDIIKGDSEYSIEKIEEIALCLRKHWRLGNLPIDNMVGLLQEKGFVICRIEFKNKKIDAFSQWYNKTPYIFLGSDKDSAVRSRFDLAHELGHLILHSHIDQDSLDSKEFNEQIEREANYFAGAFLLPIDSFPSEVMSTSINHFIMLKKRWKASISCMVKRCESLNLLTDNQIRYIQSQMTKEGMWRREPLDENIPYERPYLFKQAIELLLDNNVVTPNQIIDNIAYNKDDIESLCFLPKGLLERNTKVYNITLKN